MLKYNKILQDKKIIINGASKGIGQAVALGFAHQGAHVGLISRNENLLRENVEQIKKEGCTAFHRVADVSNYKQLKSAMEGLISELGGIDVLVNNAGIVKINYIPETVEEIDQILDVNLKGVIYGIFIALPYFNEQKKGSIISTSSASALIETNKIINNNALYTASKAGINLFSFCISQGLSKRIKVNVLMPGWVRTDMVAATGNDVNEYLEKHFDVANPEDIVPFYTFYASEESKRMSGDIVNLPLLRMAIRFAREYMESPSDDWSIIGPALEKYSRGIYNHVKDHTRLLKFLLEGNAKGSSMMPR